MPEPSEFQKLKERLHNINDWKQEHMKEFAVLSHRVNELHEDRHAYATKEQVTAALEAIRVLIENGAKTVATEISYLKTEMGKEVGRFKEDIKPLKKAIYWAVYMVVGAVIASGLALILKGPNL